MNKEELRKRRKQLGMTQDSFAKALRVSTNTVARWERGEQAIPVLLDPALMHVESTFTKSKPFDVAAAVAKFKDAAEIMNAWFIHEGRPPLTDFGVLFSGGWETFTVAEKIDAIVDGKRVLDRNLAAEKQP